MMINESETQIRLRRATEALQIAKARENEARQALASAVQSTATAKAKYEELFHRWNKEEYAKQMNDYRHCTK